MKLSYLVKEPQKFNRYIQSLNLPAQLIHQVLSQKRLSINGVFRDYFDEVFAGDHVQIELPPELASSSLVGEDIPLRIVFEDDYLLIIDKPANMPVMVTKAHPHGTLLNALAFYFQNHDIFCPIHLVNRLDKETTGLIIVAKNRYIKYQLSENLHSKIEREYYAIAMGLFQNKSGIISSSIGQPDPMSMKRTVMATGKEAVTEYRVLQEYHGQSLLAITLKTGRTHQIRVHMAAECHPLIGDSLYGNNAPKGLNLMLQSHHIRFIHPVTQQVIEINLDLAESLQTYLQNPMN